MNRWVIVTLIMAGTVVMAECADAQRLELLHEEYADMPTDLMISELAPWQVDEPEEQARALVIISAARGWVENVVLEGQRLAQEEEQWTLSTEDVKNLRALALGCVRPSAIAWIHNLTIGIGVPIDELPHFTRVTLNAKCYQTLGDVNASTAAWTQETGVHE